MTSVEQENIIRKVDKFTKTSEDGRKFIYFRKLIAEKDKKLAENLCIQRGYGSIEDTLYEVVIRKIRTAGVKVRKRRTHDPEGVIYLTTKNQVQND
jgi:hypothetical protein